MNDAERIRAVDAVADAIIADADSLAQSSHFVRERLVPNVLQFRVLTELPIVEVLARVFVEHRGGYFVDHAF